MPDPAAQPALNPAVPNPWLLVGVVMVGNFLGPLYSSVANVVLPNLVASFGSDIDTMEWVITGYMLGYSIAMPLAGWMADTYGRRRMYLIGLGLFTLASVLTAFAWDPSSLIAFRILQAIGGGIVSPTSMALIVDVVPAQQRGRALGVWGLGMMLAPTFGPTVSGWIVDNLDDWRLIFLLGIPFGVAGLLLAYAKLPQDDKRISRAPFDAWGFGLLTTALASFLIPLTQGNRLGWDDPSVQGGFVLAALAFAGFIWREWHAPYPMIDLALFGERTFALAAGMRGIVGMAFYLPIFLLPLFTQNILGWPATLSGLVLVPAGLTMALLMPLAGALSDRIGARALVLSGMVLAAFGTFLFARIDIDWDVNRIAVDSLIRTAALGLVFTPLTAVALAAVPRNLAGSASGVLNTIWQVGGSLGIAVGQTYLTNRSAVRLSEAAGSAVLSRPAIVQALHGLASRLPPAAAQAMLAKEVALLATVQAYGDTFLLAAVVMMFGIPAALLLPKKRRSPS
jgi:DHA2 family multidrug resistance protein